MWNCQPTQDLADAGVTRVYITRIERGDSSAGINLVKLEKVLGRLGHKLSDFIALAEKRRDAVLADAEGLLGSMV